MRDPYQTLRSELVAAAARMDAGSAPAPRRWWPGRSRQLAVVLAGLIICGSAAAGVVSLTGSASQPLAGTVPGRIASAAPTGPSSVAGFKYTIRTYPALNAGSVAAGWVASITYSNPKTGVIGGGQSGGGGYPTPANPVFQGTGVNLGEPSRRGDTVAFVMTGPAVAAVRVGVRTIRTFTSPQLPAGDRAAVFFVPAHSPQPVLNLPAGKPIQHLKIPGPHGAHTIAVEAVVPLDAAGRALPSRPSPTPIDATSFWQAPSAVSSHHQTSRYHGRTRPRPGPCELSEHGLPGLTREWGRTITRIVPVTNAAGQLFVSCINTEYYLNRTPLNVGLLLDARHPGQTLDALPGAQPIHANQNLVAYNAVNLAAKRIANAWLVVQGGSSQAQRLKVLHALRIVKLDVARPTSKPGH